MLYPLSYEGRGAEGSTRQIVGCDGESRLYLRQYM